MEKLNFVQNGVVKLPPGFRFHPTDEELVVQYLKRKAFSCPLPASIIPELDICKLDPWDLPGDPGRERYFFSRREWKYPNGSRANRATGSGYWKTTGCDKQVLASRSNQVVGMKKALVFYKGKPPRGLKTDWVMHEYRLTDVVVGACNLLQRRNSTQNSIMPMEEWVLCRIFLKIKSKKDALEINQISEKCGASSPRRSRHVLIDYMNGEDAESRSSSHSEASVITEMSSAGCPDEEISSCNSTSSLAGCKNNH